MGLVRGDAGTEEPLVLFGGALAVDREREWPVGWLPRGRVPGCGDGLAEDDFAGAGFVENVRENIFSFDELEPDDDDDDDDFGDDEGR